jgi:integrase/recombinase XerC
MVEPGAAKLEPIERYLDVLRSQRQLAPLTAAAYRRDLLELARRSGEASWSELGQAELRRLAARLHAEGLAPRSIARKLSSWRGFFRWLAREGALPANPADGVRAPKRPRPLPKALPVDAAVQLVATPVHPHQGQPEPDDLCSQAMFELLYSSGLRVSELAQLDLHYTAEAAGTPSRGWIDLEAGEVTVTGKGGKMRRVPVGQAARKALAAWLACRPAPADGSAALFLTRRGVRISPRAVQLRLKAHAQRSGASQHVHPHMLRHSFASHLLQSSGDLRAVQDMLGHASIASTQIYTALDFQHLAAVYDQAHPRAKRKSGKDEDA